MKIAIDMDNTIIDELGSTLRPGIINFLEELAARHELILWTNSRRNGNHRHPHACYRQKHLSDQV